MSFNLDRVIYTLLQAEPFFAHFILNTKVQYDVEGVPTAGVSVRGGQISLAINTEYMGTHQLPQQVAILQHEVFHVLLEHCGSRMYGVENLQAKNIAMDCAINQMIKNLPEGCVTLKGLSDALESQLLPLQEWEYYYQQMKDSDKVQKVPQPNHEMMNGSEADGEGDTELEKALNKAAIKNAAEKSAKAAAGNVGEHVAKLLGNLSANATLPWKQLLRNFVASSRSVVRKNTRMRADRRFGLDVPGKKKLRKLSLAVCVDSSGSISDESFSAFITEVCGIAKQTNVTYLIDADCVVQNVVVITGGKLPEKAKARHGNGGTAYQPAIDAAMQRDVDAIIYFGDFDTSDVPKNPGVPFLWVGVGDQKPPADFGRHVVLSGKGGL